MNLSADKGTMEDRTWPGNLTFQALVLTQQLVAIYTHCFSHFLNMCISKACETPAIRNMMGIVGYVSVFLSASANRANALQRGIADSNLIETRY
ncbi:hypothetical protein PR048_010093 [Dryococelus australis]|uniref:Uncharacterized protein n=1 Tax=Dryococelus australis TaxID=614101 RepID=A0ABQ9I1T9_9NEOP|nr:hypothetical protein PR048_010093 [Dryococelus australis]